MTEVHNAGSPEATGRKRPSLLVLLPLIVFGILCLLFFVQLLKGGASNILPSALIDKPAPQFDLAPLEGLTIDGKTVPGFKHADLDGKVTLVNFWASWCVPCRQEHPMLLELAKDDRFMLAGINVRDSTKKALGYLIEHKNPFALNGVDQSYRTAIDFGVTGQPETFVIDKFGCIRYKHVGPLYEKLWQEKLSPLIDTALKETAPPAGCTGVGASG